MTISRHPDFIVVSTGYTNPDFSGISEIESDLNWETRTLLEGICASVENVVDEMTADTGEFLASFGEPFEALV